MCFEINVKCQAVDIEHIINTQCITRLQHFKEYYNINDKELCNVTIINDFTLHVPVSNFLCN